MTTHEEQAVGPGAGAPNLESAVDLAPPPPDWSPPDPRSVVQAVGPPEPPEPAERRQFWWVPGAATVLVILGVIAVTLWQMPFNLLFTETTTTGGDTGAPIALPAYL